MIAQRSFHSEKPSAKEKPKENPTASKYREAFEGLKQKINKQNQDDDRMNTADPINQMKDSIYAEFKYGGAKIDPSKQAEVNTAEKLKTEHFVHESAKTEQTQAKQTENTSQNKDNTTQTQSNTGAQDATRTQSTSGAHNATGAQAQSTSEASKTESSKVEDSTKSQNSTTAEGLKSKITEKVPFIGKVVDYVADSWEQTFPSERYSVKAEQTRKQAKEAAEKEKTKKEYTEEELAMVKPR